MKVFPVAASCAALLGYPMAARAQINTPTPAKETTPDLFKYGAGPVFVPNDDGQQFYTIGSTAPRDSNLVSQRIELRITGDSPGHTFTHTLDINTGKHKTVAAMNAFVADVFRRFLAGPVSAGQEFGKIGDVNLGGEIRFVAESTDRLDYKIVTPGKEDNLGHFSRTDVQTFLSILTSKGS